jgi:hypothetical protein
LCRYNEDVAGHRAFVAEYVSRALLPLMETRVRALNSNIAATRKGLKNQFKSFWGRSTGKGRAWVGVFVWSPLF